MALLRVVSGSNAGTVYEVSRDSLLLGRDLDATIQIPDQGVSRRHAEIIRMGELCLIKDCGSRNGTFVNDEQVTERVLRAGDRIKVGNTVFVFEDRPGLMEESRLIHFHDGAVSPRETVSLSLGTSTAVATPEVAKEYRESPLLAAVERIANIVAAEKNIRTLLEKAVAEAGRAVRAGSAYVFRRRVTEEREEYHLLASWTNENTKRTGRLRVSRSVMRQAARDGTTVLVNDPGLDMRFSAQDSIISQGLQTIICAPLKVQDRVLGVLYAADSLDEKGFSPEDMELFGAAAAQLGLAMAFFRAQAKHDAFFRKGMGILVSAIEHRLPQKKGASERVAGFCAAIARAMHLDRSDIRYAWLSGLLHDVAVLGLSDRELEEAVLLPIRRKRAAEQLLSSLADFKPVLEAIVDQDERYDGSGQPEGKKGDEVPLLAQILGLARYFNSLLSGDVLTGGELPVREAVLRVNEVKDKLFPARVVNGLLVAYRQGQLFAPEQEFSSISV